jgi:hypothetical protein
MSLQALNGRPAAKAPFPVAQYTGLPSVVETAGRVLSQEIANDINYI